MALLSTALRPPAALGPAAVVRLAANAGATGIEVGPGSALSHIAPLVSHAAGAGLGLGLIWGSLPETPLGRDRRRPWACATADREERLAAVALATRALEHASALGLRTIAVALGRVPLHASDEDLRAAFARDALAEDEEGGALLAAALAERRALGPAVLDACRFSLDRMLREAERRHVRLAIAVAARPGEAPTPREAATLLADFRGAPLGSVDDRARAQVRRQLGLGPGPPTEARLAAASLVSLRHDAVGIETGYLPGLGDGDGGAAASADARAGRSGDHSAGDAAAPADARAGRSGDRRAGDAEGGDSAAPTTGAASPEVVVVVSGRPDSSESEVAEAIARQGGPSH